MSFNGTEGTQISAAGGAALTAAYRAKNPGQRKALFFGRDHLEAILSQSDCQGIRIYYGQDASGLPELVLVGADSTGKDILDYVLDCGSPCPNECDPGSCLCS